MGKVINVEGLNIEIAGDQISKEEFDFIKDIKATYAKTPSGVAESDIDPATGYYKLPEVDAKIRFAVSAAPNLDSKFLTLKKFFKDVKQDEYDPTNFIVTDANDKKYILDDKSKKNFKDIIDVSRDITGIAGSLGASIAAAPGGPGAVIAASGAGLAGGTELIEQLGRMAGTEIDRSLGDHAKERLGEFALGSISQAATPLVLGATKYLFKGGSEKEIYKKAAEQLGVPTAEGKAAYESLSLTDKIDKGIELNMKDKLTLFQKYDTRPTFGQITDNKVVDTLETTFANVPFAAPILRSNAEAAQNSLGKRFGEVVTKNLEIPTTEIPGDVTSKIVQRGLIKERGPGKLPLGDTEYGVTNRSGFFERFRDQATVKYGALDDVIGKNTPVSLNNTLGFLKKEVGDASFPNLNKVLNDPKLSKMYAALAKDAGEEGTINYAKARILRTEIGKKLGNPVLIDPLPRATYKKLYGELSRDIQNAVGNLPDKRALTLMKKTDSWYQTNLKLIDDFLEPIAKKADVDGLVNSLINKSKTGASQISALQKALTPDEYKVLVATVIDRLGSAPVKGELAALGRTNTFNTRVFLDNYGAMEDSAKKALFGGNGKGYKTLNNSLKEINRIATYIEQQNPFKDLASTVTKGTAGTGLVVGAGAGLAAGTGDPMFLLGIPIFGYGGAAALKIMSNPKFLEWIASGTKIAGNKGLDGVAEHLGKMGIIAGNSDNDTAQLSNQYLEMIKRSAGNSEKNKAGENISKAIGEQKTTQAVAQPVKSTANLKPIQTQVTSGTSGKVTNIPQERIQEYTNLFGRIWKKLSNHD